MPSRQQSWYTALGVGALGVAAYMRRRNARQALGDTLAQIMPRMRTNNPLLDQAIGQLTDEAMEQLMSEPLPEDPEHPVDQPQVVRLRRPTQASELHDIQVPIKDAEFTPIKD